MSQVLSRISNTYTYTLQHTEELQRAQAEAEANARELWLKVQEHKRRFVCHIDGCTNTSLGPKLEAILGQGRWNWKQPTGLVLCDRCFHWICPVHLSGSVCLDCAREVG